MESFYRFVTPVHSCSYLPDQQCRMAYEYVEAMTPAEYERRIESGWRRFGRTLFRPECPMCTACQPLRILVDQFRPNRSQRRVMRRNQGEIELVVRSARATREKLALFNKYHAFQAGAKGWPEHQDTLTEYGSAYVDNPFPTEEWSYRCDSKLIAVGYVDVLPRSLSAIYFFYDPDYCDRSLGTWNVLQIIDAARRRGLPYVHLGYYVAGCGSMEYKKNFRPNQVLVDGRWRDHVT